jgi:DNA-directed RNA polymerase specialized sigma24 family protein
MLSFEEEVDALVTAGLLTEQQARAYVYREIEATPRKAAADAMDITLSTYDSHVENARRNVTAARETVEAVESIRNQLPDDKNV